ncbi:MAG: hypothetical protein HY894_05855, partial [Deltaproteobacteria bacterium]|nr:hypothetical protein [Deltaproteobacteria bacterium]
MPENKKGIFSKFFFKGYKSPETRSAEAIREISFYKKLYDESLQHALMDNRQPSETASDSRPYVDAEHERLLQKAREPSTGPDELDELVDSARGLSYHRAYVIPLSEINSTATRIIEEMNEWGVPDETIGRLREKFRKKGTASDNEKQTRRDLFWLFDEYNYWEEYIDWYHVGLFKETLIYSFFLSFRAQREIVFLGNSGSYKISRRKSAPRNDTQWNKSEVP